MQTMRTMLTQTPPFVSGNRQCRFGSGGLLPPSRLSALGGAIGTCIAISMAMERAWLCRTQNCGALRLNPKQAGRLYGRGCFRARLGWKVVVRQRPSRHLRRFGRMLRGRFVMLGLRDRRRIARSWKWLGRRLYAAACTDTDTACPSAANAASSCSSREAWSSRNRRSTNSRFQRSRRLSSARVMPVSRSCR